MRGDVELRIVDRDNIVEKTSKRGLTLKEIVSSSNEDEKREFEDAEAAIVDLVGEIMSKADSGNRDSILEDLVNSDETFILILKNLKYPMGEEDISSMTFLELESKLVKVRDYMVSQNCAPILESLFDKYGDFSASSTSNPRTKMHVLNIVGGVAQSMCNTKVKDITANLLFNWWKNFQLAQHVGFNVQFAFDHLYRLAQAQFRMEGEFKADAKLLESQIKIEELILSQETKLEVLKDKQKQLIRSKRRKSILEKECLIQDMESRLMPAGMGLL
ncbi:uncharacterized protein LOC142618096 [Castanea sativa]